ncbi:MAG: C69 family dipeptidase [Candidatus Marinimicrobia bacterium]|nr:C69 family dipeptidase [Candidatus Neomarinimicrobiota bacterium]
MCDTFVALKTRTKDGSVIFGKNSDREPNEAQLLDYYPPQEHENSTNVQCTYIQIPQTEKTHGVLLSRPFWMWGAEMGINDAGVAIGNEAVFTKEPMESDGKLLGMDLLRLALERSPSSEKAVEVITELLAEYGQGGPCGFEDKKLTYHSSFLIADSSTAWVLETAGKYWVAKNIKEYYAISNGLTVGKEYDLSHPEVIDHAQSKGWLKKGAVFNFSECYSDWFYTTFSGSRQRRNCSLNNVKKDFAIQDAFSALRDHGVNEYQPHKHLFMNKVCAHAAYPVSRHASQSTSSMVTHLKPSGSMAWLTGTSSPCTSIFKPIWVSDVLLPESARHGTGVYSDKSLWWRHEELHRRSLKNFSMSITLYEEERNQIEEEWIKMTEEIEPEKCKEFSEYAFLKSEQKRIEWLELIKASNQNHTGNMMYKLYWKNQNKKANFLP